MKFLSIFTLLLLLSSTTYASGIRPRENNLDMLNNNIDNLYYKDPFGREPNPKLDRKILEDDVIKKSGNFYLTANFGVSTFNFTDPNYALTYSASLTFGTNFHRYIGIEFSGLYETFKFNKNNQDIDIQSVLLIGLVTFRYAFQPAMDISIIPFLGIGLNVGSAFISDSDIGNVSIFPDAIRYQITAGLSTKAGVRFKFYNFLIGVGAIYNPNLINLIYAPHIYLELGATF